MGGYSQANIGVHLPLSHAISARRDASMAHSLVTGGLLCH